MNKKRMLVRFLLAAWMVAGIFTTPIQGREASAAANPSISVSVGWIKAPPETVCLGDDVPVIYVYVVFINTQTSGGVTSVPGNTYRGDLLASTRGIGAVSPQKVNLGLTTGSGRVYATYKATQTGFDEITITGTFIPVDPAGASTGSFEVVRCDYDISIGASDYVTNPSAEIDTELHGKGIISTGDTGMVEGTGTYQYNVTIMYTPPPTLICEMLWKETNDSTFEVFGTASVDMMLFGLNFYPLDIKPIVADCQDQEGKKIEKQLLPGATVDVNAELGLGKYSIATSESEVQFSFKYGKGTGVIWLVKRKAK